MALIPPMDRAVGNHRPLTAGKPVRLRPLPRVPVDPASSEARNPRGLLHDDARIVEVRRACRFAVDDDFGAGPYGQAGAAAAAFLVAHDVTPLGSPDVAVAVGKGRLGVIHIEIMACSDQ